MISRPEASTASAGPWAIRGRHARSFLKWVVSSIVIIVPVFLFSTLITFALGAASGLNPAAGIAGDSATAEMIEQINTELGLNKPLLEQYLTWMQGILTGDLGHSWFNQVQVSELIQQRLAVSMSVAGLALLIGIVVGVSLGILAAVYQGRWIDRAITGVTTVISTLPAFVVAIGLILVFSLWLRWLPSAGYVSPSENFSVWLKLITMPAIALSVDVAAELARQLRTGLVSTLQENYVVGAIVRGLGWPRILFVHVLRNGAGPALSILGMKIPTLLGGAVVTETIFTMPGLGMLSADSALRGDVPVVQGALVISIAFVLVANVLINILQGTLQPASRRRT